MIKTWWLLAGLLFLRLSLSGQNPAGTGLTERIGEPELKQYLQVLSSSEMEGRATGTAGGYRAAGYISGEFQRLGLISPKGLQGYMQYYELMKDTVMPRLLKIGSNKYYFGKDFRISRGARRQNEFRGREIVLAGYGISRVDYDDYRNKDVKGKVVVIFPGEPQNLPALPEGSSPETEAGQWLLERAVTAGEKGALALLVVQSAGEAENSTPILQNTGIDSLLPPVPVVTITLAMFKELFVETAGARILEAADHKKPLDFFQVKKKMKIHLSYGRTSIPVKAANVIGLIEGTDKKDEYLIISAHYDHLGKDNHKIYYGADDNGSGTAALISLAEAFSDARKKGQGPRRTILFVAFSGEELGLLGSAYFVDNPIIDLNALSAVVNMDMIGRVQSKRDFKKERDYLYVVGDDKTSSDLSGLVREANLSAGLHLDYKYNNPEDKEMLFYRSDHYSFARRGVPVVFFTNGVHADYHLSTDTIDKIDFEVMAKRARFIFMVAWKIDRQEQILKRDLKIESK